MSVFNTSIGFGAYAGTNFGTFGQQSGLLIDITNSNALVYFWPKGKTLEEAGDEDIDLPPGILQSWAGSKVSDRLAWLIKPDGTLVGWSPREGQEVVTIRRGSGLVTSPRASEGTGDPVQQGEIVFVPGSSPVPEGVKVKSGFNALSFEKKLALGGAIFGAVMIIVFALKT